MKDHLLVICRTHSGEQIIYKKTYDRGEWVKDRDNFLEDVEKIKNHHKRIAVHFLTTHNEHHKSIEEYDPYFENASFYKDLDRFIKAIEMCKLTGELGEGWMFEMLK